MNKVIQGGEFSSLIENLDIASLGFFVKLLRHISAARYTRLAYGELAHLAGCSRNTAQRHVETLEAAGLLCVLRQRIDQKRCSINAYKITCPAHFLGYLLGESLGSLLESLSNGVQNLVRDSVDSDSFDVVVADDNLEIFRESKSLDLPAPPEAQQDLNNDGMDVPPSMNAVSWAYLQSIGVVLNQTSRELAAYPPDKVKQAIGIARQKATKNLAGYTLEILRNGSLDTPPPPPPAATPNFQGGTLTENVVNKVIHKPPPMDDDTAPGEAATEPDLPDELETETDVNAAALARLREMQVQAEIPAPIYNRPITREAWAWAAAMQQFELQDRVSFDTWLRQAAFLRYADGIYEIACPNSYARDMCQHRLYRNIRRLLSDVYGAPVELLFVVQSAPV